eukprot:SAG31_NODE_31809_length_363_cov_130.795455_1_plen_29_part_10
MAQARTLAKTKFSPSVLISVTLTVLEICY